MVNLPYNAPRRREQARATRAAVIAAAHDLFLEQGYTATSISQIASAARVGDQTIYRIFHNKVTLLREVILSAVSGGEPGAAEREPDDLSARLSAAITPEKRLRAIADWSAGTYERGAAELEEVVFSAAAADPGAQELVQFLREQRYQDVRALVAAVAGEAEPPPGMSLDDIADYIYAVWSSPVYLQLVRDRGWTTEKYIAWSVRMVQRLFLDQMSQ